MQSIFESVINLERDERIVKLYHLLIIFGICIIFLNIMPSYNFVYTKQWREVLNILEPYVIRPFWAVGISVGIVLIIHYITPGIDQLLDRFNIFIRVIVIIG